MKDNWISVLEEMPKNGSDVMFYVEETNCVGIGMYYEDEGFMLVGDYENITFNVPQETVTYWMPSPHTPHYTPDYSSESDDL